MYICAWSLRIKHFYFWIWICNITTYDGSPTKGSLNRFSQNELALSGTKPILQRARYWNQHDDVIKWTHFPRHCFIPNINSTDLSIHSCFIILWGIPLARRYCVTHWTADRECRATVPRNTCYKRSLRPYIWFHVSPFHYPFFCFRFSGFLVSSFSSSLAWSWASVTGTCPCIGGWERAPSLWP